MGFVTPYLGEEGMFCGVVVKLCVVWCGVVWCDTVWC